MILTYNEVMKIAPGHRWVQWSLKLYTQETQHAMECVRLADLMIDLYFSKMLLCVIPCQFVLTTVDWNNTDSENSFSKFKSSLAGEERL